jgi:hypothetical protein
VEGVVIAAVIATAAVLYLLAVLGLCRAAANGDRYLADVDEDDADRAHGGGW